MCNNTAVDLIGVFERPLRVQPQLMAGNLIGIHPMVSSLMISNLINGR